MSAKRFVGFVQARMASTRLPGKVMADICGRPMVWHVWNRLAASKLLDQTVMVVSTNPLDQPMIEYARKENIPCYAGSEADLLERYYQAAKLFKADVIVRVTADCPLVDPDLADDLIRAFKESREPLDYVSNSRPAATYPHGLDLELFTLEALERAWREVQDPFRREWLTTNFFEHPEEYRTKNVKGSEDGSNFRLTVDYAEDLELVRRIFSALGKGERIFGLAEIMELLKKQPELLRINAGHHRNEGYLKDLAKAKPSS